MLISAIAIAQDTDPGAILKKVAAAYDALDSYSATGIVLSEIDSNGTKINLTTSFSIKLKKPNLYQITWDQKNSGMPDSSQPGAVWNTGTQPYVYLGIAKAYSKISNDEMALSAATGISDGVAFTIPSLFLKQEATPFSRFSEFRLIGTEVVEGEECYIINGSSPVSKNESFWVSKKSYLIRKHARALDQSGGSGEILKMTDQDLDAAIKAMGQEVTAASKEAMKKMMKEAQEMMSKSNVKGMVTELHIKMSMPKLVAGDMAFKVPEGTALKESLFEGIFKSQ